MKKNKHLYIALFCFINFSLISQCDTLLLIKKLDSFLNNSVILKKNSNKKVNLILDSIFDKHYSYRNKSSHTAFKKDSKQVKVSFIYKLGNEVLIFTRVTGRGLIYKIYIVNLITNGVNKYATLRQCKTLEDIKNSQVAHLIYCD